MYLLIIDVVETKEFDNVSFRNPKRLIKPKIPGKRMLLIL